MSFITFLGVKLNPVESLHPSEMGANESKPRTKRSFLNSFSVANAATTEDNIDNVLPKSPLAPDTPGSQSGPSYDTAKLFEPGKLEDFVDDSPSSPFFEKDDSDDPEVARKNLEVGFFHLKLPSYQDGAD